MNRVQAITIDQLEAKVGELNQAALRLQRLLAARWLESLLGGLRFAVEKELAKERLHERKDLPLALLFGLIPSAARVWAEFRPESPQARATAYALDKWEKSDQYGDVRVSLREQRAGIINISQIRRQKLFSEEEVVRVEEAQGGRVSSLEGLEKEGQALIDYLLSENGPIPDEIEVYRRLRPAPLKIQVRLVPVSKPTDL